jgi:hypothetical protein
MKSNVPRAFFPVTIRGNLGTPDLKMNSDTIYIDRIYLQNGFPIDSKELVLDYC